MGKHGKKKRGKQILEGHKRVGKRFIPPMKQFPMTETGYVNDMLPELIWIGLINDRVNYIRGARIIEKVFLAVDKSKKRRSRGKLCIDV